MKSSLFQRILWRGKTESQPNASTMKRYDILICTVKSHRKVSLLVIDRKSLEKRKRPVSRSPRWMECRIISDLKKPNQVRFRSKPRDMKFPAACKQRIAFQARTINVRIFVLDIMEQLRLRSRWADTTSFCYFAQLQN